MISHLKPEGPEAPAADTSKLITSGLPCAPSTRHPVRCADRRRGRPDTAPARLPDPADSRRGARALPGAHSGTAAGRRPGPPSRRRTRRPPACPRNTAAWLRRPPATAALLPAATAATRLPASDVPCGRNRKPKQQLPASSREERGGTRYKAPEAARGGSRLASRVAPGSGVCREKGSRSYGSSARLGCWARWRAGVCRRWRPPRGAR